jgi:hypothetical protein
VALGYADGQSSAHGLSFAAGSGLRSALVISGENGGQAAFYMFRGQKRCSQTEWAEDISGSPGHSDAKRERCHSLSVRRLLVFHFDAADALARIGSKFSGRWD